MIGFIIATCAPGAYTAVALIAARVCYRRNRPSRVPLCGRGAHAEHRPPGSRGYVVYHHISACYDRGCYDQGRRAGSKRDWDDPWTCGGVGAAFTEAILCGLFWPVTGLIAGIFGAVTLGHPETPAEEEARLAALAADIKRLEIES